MSKLDWIDAEREFEAAFAGKQSFVFRFHDARQAMGSGGSKRIFTASHPSDFVVVDRGAMFYAEVKDCQDGVSFPFANIKKSQWSAAIQTVAAGGSYFFFIRAAMSGVWYKVPGITLIAIRKVKQSVKWSELAGLEWKR